ncbi:iron complex transport system ATP-binding protein [Thermocatellispora tengchongensis]|uniref:Iron complex transport system ATP-binding protein n=1 Tax=Thermocatellispora tengchongensis TaxID=1073253 RepID=A0A840PMX1_9ACTN|nr:heme ABC transporter ATP-binding protein [Thermocatellispora tengchongensis]MBB5138387.1 iron complex transport system ATP-binding protein [Thermocatellispora tengchongensis]
MIVVDGLRVEAGKSVILDGVDLTVPPGRMLALVGPNGAGKTTLLRTIAGLHRPSRGRVLLEDRPVHSLRPQVLARRIAYLPQDTALSFPFTAYQVTLMGRHPHMGRFALEGAADHEAAEQAMAATGTTRLADRSMATLSGGERQLVLLAKALAQDAPVLLADEPVSALDLRHQLAVLQLLRACADAGRTVLVVLHDLNLAARYCTELALLAGGRVLAAGEPAHVLTPAHLHEAYGVRAVVRRDDVTDSLTVTALETT